MFDVICVHPNQYKGKSLSSISSNDFMKCPVVATENCSNPEEHFGIMIGLVGGSNNEKQESSNDPVGASNTEEGPSKKEQTTRQVATEPDKKTFNLKLYLMLAAISFVMVIAIAIISYLKCRHRKRRPRERHPAIPMKSFFYRKLPNRPSAVVETFDEKGKARKESQRNDSLRHTSRNEVNQNLIKNIGNSELPPKSHESKDVLKHDIESRVLPSDLHDVAVQSTPEDEIMVLGGYMQVR